MKRNILCLILAFTMLFAALPLCVTAVGTEIETVTLTVTPPKAGTKSLECPPQATLTSTGCTVEGCGWLYGLNMYTTEELDVTFAEGETYYMLAYLKADEGSIFKKSGEQYTGIDEGADKFKGCTVSGGTLEFAGSRTLNTDYAKGDFLTVKIGVTAVKAEAPANDYFGVWISDIDQTPNVGGGVKIEYVCDDGSVPADSGKIWKSSTNQTVPAGTEVTLTAIPAEGYNFVAWFRANINKADAGDPHYLEDKYVSSEAKLTFKGNPVGEGEPPYVCAVFEKAPAHPADQIEVWTTEGGKIAVKYTPDVEAGPIKTRDGTQFVALGDIVPFYKGDEVTVIAKADEGYTFKGWYRANIEGEEDPSQRYIGSVISTAQSYTYKPGVTVLPGDKEALRSVCAVFEKGAGFMPGDVDGNGAVKSDDARLALRAAVRLENFWNRPDSREYKAANVVRDDKIGADDARLILRAAVKLETLG